MDKTMEDEISLSAKAFAAGMWPGISKHDAKQREYVERVYIAGATAENSRAQKLVDALEQIINHGENIRSTYKVGKPAFYIKIANEALQQWKGEKEMEPKEPLIPLAVYKQQGCETDLTNPTK